MNFFSTLRRNFMAMRLLTQLMGNPKLTTQGFLSLHNLNETKNLHQMFLQGRKVGKKELSHVTIIFSYAVPVAILYHDNGMWIYTDQKFSKTTTKHVNDLKKKRVGSFQTTNQKNLERIIAKEMATRLSAYGAPLKKEIVSKDDEAKKQPFWKKGKKPEFDFPTCTPTIRL